MLECPNCNVEKMIKVIGDYHFTESGLSNLYLKEWPLFRCGNCDVEMPLLPDSDGFTVWLAEQLIKQRERLCGEDVLFLRKGLGFTGAKLADFLGVNRVEVSRWENNRQPISFQSDFYLRMQTVDKLLTPQHLVSLIRALRNYQRDTRTSPLEYHWPHSPQSSLQ